MCNQGIMKFLKCLICKGEIDLVGNDSLVERKVKCRKCGYSNDKDKQPEVFVIRKRSFTVP